ncbi:hypothetical protein BDM02DRAFT_3109236 [Thelephora ganbajun]|uniref:Uncharacterized protein n=1 Tax=Thelephora ganbajun TaxID=370292 RepID=A0ACB6ZRK8_THEGA|nr:hypothetical protein BDM02DRAFT_3109236 [Thelephora ganbajun]
MSQGYFSPGPFFVPRRTIRMQTQLLLGVQDPNHPAQQPFGGVQQFFVERHPQNAFTIPAHLAVNGIGRMDEEDNEEEEDEGDEEANGADARTESDWSRTGSQGSTSATPASNNTVTPSIWTTSDYDDTGRVYDRTLKLGGLEELRGSFESELRDPSAWTLQRVAVLTDTDGEFAVREIVRLWLSLVVRSTGTLVGEPLRLPHVPRPEELPLHRPMVWDEANQLDSKARELCFGREVNELYEQDARATILFLFPEARTKGLSVLDKRRIFAVASNVWMFDQTRAEGLLWVMDREYPHTRQEDGREWANSMSKDFMIYTVLFPPPVVAVL